LNKAEGKGDLYQSITAGEDFSGIPLAIKVTLSPKQDVRA
jgi:hypothetical protein